MIHLAIGLFLAFIVLAFVIRYVYWLIDSEGARLARIETDPAFRAATIAQLGETLAANPDDTRSLRLRADAYLFDYNWPAAERDLAVFVEHVPGDDTAWGELAEARLRTGNFRQALEAAERAAEQDPAYIDYRALTCRACLLLGDLSGAKDALVEWKRLAEETGRERAQSRPRRIANWLPMVSPLENPFLHLHDAAVSLAEGDRESAGELIDRAENSPHGVNWDLVSDDPVLKPLLSVRGDVQPAAGGRN